MSRPKPSGLRPAVAILVAGMHRSGTSAITRVINLLGCDGLDAVMDGDRFNETGYWESADIAALNDEVLAAMGSSWHGWTPHGRPWGELPDRSSLEARAAGLVSRQFADSRLFVLKDPRFCRVLPFWRDVLAGLGAEVRVVLPIRDRVEVAASLLHRNGLNPSITQLTWLRHVLDAERDSRGLKRVFIEFEELTRDWRQAAARISEALDVTWPRPPEDSGAEIDRFLSPSLRHHDARVAASVERVTPIPSPLLVEALSIMKASAGPGGARAADLHRLDELREGFDQASAMFRQPVSEIEAHGRRLKGRLDDLAARHGKAEARAAAQATSIEALATDLADARELLNTLQGDLQVAASRAADGEDLVLTLRVLLEEAQLVQKANAAELEALRSHLMGHERTEDRLRELSQAHETMKVHYNKMKDHYDATKVRLGETKDKLARLSRTHEAARQALAERSQELSAAREALGGVLHSGSWRLTAPYRRARAWVGARS